MKLKQRTITINKQKIDCYGCCYFHLEDNKLTMRNVFGPVDHIWPDGSKYKILNKKQLNNLLK